MVPFPRLFVVVTGLPASGKTTVGRALSNQLHLPFMDKDHVLETLFDALGAESPQGRTRLSRASDAVLESMALASQGAVLVSFWRRQGMSGASGTPTEWLSALAASDAVVEVHCECDPAVAVDRFARRQRHPDHFDQRFSEEELLKGFRQLGMEGSMLGTAAVRVDTNDAVDLPSVTLLVREAATRYGWSEID